MPVVEVGDPRDPRLADYVRLNEPTERRRIERSGAFFIAEGDLVIRTLLATRRWPVRSVLVTPARLEALADALGARPEVDVFVAGREVLQAVAGFDVHRGALASAVRAPLPPLDDVLGGRLVVGLEGVNDHENVGSIFRSAVAFGADAALLDPTTADPLYRRSLRVSTGHVLRLPFTRAEHWPESLERARAAGYVVVALTPAADAQPIDALASAPPERTLLLLGAEGPGLCEDTIARADRRVRIPLRADVDSLNVGVAAAIALHRLAAL